VLQLFFAADLAERKHHTTTPPHQANRAAAIATSKYAHQKGHPSSFTGWQWRYRSSPS